MPFRLTNEDGSRKSPRTIARELQKLAEDGQGLYKTDWELNLKQASGFLMSTTRDAQVKVVGSNQISDRIKENRYGAPTPADVLRPTLARFLSRNLKLFGGVQGIPSSPDIEDVKQAESAEKVLQNKWDSEDLDVTCMEALNISVCCKHGYVIVEGDFEKEDVIYEALNPFQVLIPPGIKKLADAPAVLIIQFISIDEVHRRWPKTKKYKLDAAAYDNSLDRLIPELDHSLVRVKRLFIPKSKDYPDGEQYVLVGHGTITVGGKGKETMDTYDNKCPVIDFMDEPLNVGYWGRGRHTSARSPLKQLCAVWSRVSQIMSMPLIMALFEGSGVGVEDLPDVPWVPVFVPPGTTLPQFINHPSLDTYFQYMDRAQALIAEVYSQHKPSRGQSPSARFPAKGLQSLQEQDLLADAAVGKLTLKSMTRVMQRVLGEGLRVWPDEYAGTVLGKENQYSRYVLKKGDLKPGFDVRVIPGNEDPKTKDADLKALNEAVENGMIPAQEARRLAGCPNREDMFNPDAHHIDKIRMEEVSIEKTGQAEPPWMEDNHELHRQEHEKRQIERAGESSEQEREGRRQHLVLHVKAEEPEQPPVDPAIEAQQQEITMKKQEGDLKIQQKQQEIALQAEQKRQEMALYEQQKQQEMAIKEKEMVLKARQSRSA